jgi:hypothetical protein
MAVMLSALHAGGALTPPSPHQGKFLVLISVIKKFNYLIGNRTRVLPACSVVPQPTTLHNDPLIFNLWGGILGIAATNGLLYQPG